MKMNKILSAFAAALILAGCTAAPKAPAPIKMIFETDLGNDVDDAVALDNIYKHIEDGRVELLAICLNKEGRRAPEYADILNTWYGYPDIPIGIIKDGPWCAYKNNYSQGVYDMTLEDGTPMFRGAHSEEECAAFPDAVTLYRKTLSEQEDNSVVIVSVGFFTNLARLLDSQGDEYSPLSGRELVARKVRLLSCMACCIDGISQPDGEWNVKMDKMAAIKVYNEWPGTIVSSPAEVSEAVPISREIIVDSLAWAGNHPVTKSFEAYFFNDIAPSRPMFDPTSVIFAVEGPEMFTLSPCGKMTVDSTSVSTFTPCEGGNHYYFTVTPQQAEVVKDYISNLTKRIPESQK